MPRFEMIQACQPVCQLSQKGTLHAYLPLEPFLEGGGRKSLLWLCLKLVQVSIQSGQELTMATLLDARSGRRNQCIYQCDTLDPSTMIASLFLVSVMVTCINLKHSVIYIGGRESVS